MEKINLKNILYFIYKMIEKKILKINQENNQLNPCFKYIDNFDIKINDNRFSELFEIFKSIKEQKEY